MPAIRHITICGGGNAAHVLMARLSECYHVAVYAPFGDEAVRLREGLRRHSGVVAIEGEQTQIGLPAVISPVPAEVFADAEIVILALPASAHAQTLRDALSYLKPDTWILALPARGGFDWEAMEILPEGMKLAGLQTLPWACRIRPGSYGQMVDILGTKDVVDISTQPAAWAPEAAAFCQELLHIRLQPMDSFLALTLANTGQLIHPGIMYGLFHDWGGMPFGEDEVPLFYAGVTRAIATHLQTMSDEVQAICRVLRFEGAELQAIAPLQQWLLRSYPTDIQDPSDLYTCFTTNRAYAGLRAPMQLRAENAFIPWFESRYLTEDVPFGLVVVRGIAELCGVSTPAIDMVIHWAQSVLGREWIREGRVSGVDIENSRAPQRFGISDLSGLLGVEPI